jgi:ABC-type amino acid transport substrate-binding protein
MTASRTRPPMAHLTMVLVVLAAAACEPPPDVDGTRDHPRDRGSDRVAEITVTGPAGPVSAPTFAEARAAGEATITFFFVPASGFAYRDDDGRLTGVTVELLRDFAHHVADTHDMDLRVEWMEEERWADFYGYVRDSEGGAFGIGNVTITEPRRDELDFSPPYLNNIAVLVTHEDVPELRSMDDIPAAFQGLTALPYPGTLHEDRLEVIRDRWLPDMPAHPVASNDELVSLLARGGHFGYIDVYNYWRARQAGQPLRRHPVGDDASEAFGVILPSGSDWTPVMDRFFAHGDGYIRSQRFQDRLRHHLGDELAELLTAGAPTDRAGQGEGRS